MTNVIDVILGDSSPFKDCNVAPRGYVLIRDDEMIQLDDLWIDGNIPDYIRVIELEVEDYDFSMYVSNDYDRMLSKYYLFWNSCHFENYNDVLIDLGCFSTNNPIKFIKKIDPNCVSFYRDYESEIRYNPAIDGDMWLDEDVRCVLDYCYDNKEYDTYNCDGFHCHSLEEFHFITLYFVDGSVYNTINDLKLFNCELPRGYEFIFLEYIDEELNEEFDEYLIYDSCMFTEDEFIKFYFEVSKIGKEFKPNEYSITGKCVGFDNIVALVNMRK